MPTISFQSPAVLICLAAVPLLWLIWRRACARGRQVEQRFRGGREFSAAGTRQGIARHLALALLITGLAGPTGLGPHGSGTAAVPVVFVLDVSPSMAAPDGAPDRLSAGRAAIRALCALLPDARAALVAGGGDAAVVCPPTADRDAFLAILAQATTGWMPAGTCLRPALQAACGVVEREAGGAVVVLVSDGEDHGPSPQGLLRRMRRAGAVVHTIVVGSAAGVLLPSMPPGEAASPPGEATSPPVTRARPEAMAAWARAGGGRAWAAAGALPTRADRVVPRAVRLAAARRDGRAVDLGGWLYLAAALLLVAGWLRDGG